MLSVQSWHLTYLAYDMSFHSKEKVAPSNYGVKHWLKWALCGYAAAQSKTQLQS